MIRQIAHRIVRAEPGLRARRGDPSLCSDLVPSLTGGDPQPARHRLQLHCASVPRQESADLGIAKDPSKPSIRPGATHVGLRQHEGCAALPDSWRISAQPWARYVTDAMRSAQAGGVRRGALQGDASPFGPMGFVRLVATQTDKAGINEAGGTQGKGEVGDEGGAAAESREEEGKERKEGEGVGGDTGGEASSGEAQAGGLKEAWKRVTVLLGGVSGAVRSAGRRISEFGPVTAASKVRGRNAATGQLTSYQ